LTYRNHQELKAAGLIPWPVFHRQDDFRWLERYLLDGEPYIALAPHPIRVNEVIPWLRRCFAMMPASTKVHGLGLTTAPVLKHFPFASVDSTSWVTLAATYHILIPTFNRGRPDFKHRPRQISVTERPSSQGIHVDRCDSFVREQVEQFLEEAGTTLAEVRVSEPRESANQHGCAPTSNTIRVWRPPPIPGCSSSLIATMNSAWHYFRVEHKPGCCHLPNYKTNARGRCKSIAAARVSSHE
jgi:hypothetical protein